MESDIVLRVTRLIENPDGFPRKEAERLQLALAAEVRLDPLRSPVFLICGVDCAYSRDSSRVYAAAVLLQAGDPTTRATSCASRGRPFPYAPGLLSLREAAVSIQAIRGLPARPDLILCDGHGIAHPRGFGLASLVGLLTGIPAIGVAKQKLFGFFEMPGASRGACSALEVVQGGSTKRLGTVVRTQAGRKPVFVSPGNGISHGDAVAWVLRLAQESRQPQPLRLAHRAACELRNQRDKNDRVKDGVCAGKDAYHAQLNPLRRHPPPAAIV